MQRIMMMVCASALVAGTVCGQTVATWTNTLGGALEIGGNWDTLVVPDEAAHAVFAVTDASVTVTSETGLTNRSITVDGTGTVTFHLDEDVEYRATGTSSTGLPGSPGVLAATGGGPGANAILSQGMFAAEDRVIVSAEQGRGSMLVTGDKTVMDVKYFVVGQNDDGGNRMEVAEGAMVNASGGVYVGNGYGDNNVLTIRNGGVVNNSSDLRIGVAGNWNTLMVCDGGTNFNSAHLYLGNGGYGNRLVVSGPLTVFEVGRFSLTGGGGENAAEVTKGGSVLTGEIGIGSGEGNEIVVSSGGWLGTDYRSGGGTMTVGNGTGTATLTVTNGGTVHLVQSIVIGSNWASSNRVYVAGSNSVVRVNGGSIYGITIGYPGSYNELRVEDGGVVTLGSYSGVGFSGSTGNRIVVGNGGSVTNFGYLYLGFASPGNEIVSDGGGLFYSAASMNMGAGYGPWDSSGGEAARGNRLWAKNGGQVLLGHTLTVGSVAGADGNIVRVEGTGSKITMNGMQNLIIGNVSASNRLEIADGGHFQTIGQVLVGRMDNAATSNNVIRIENGTADFEINHENYYGLTVAAGGRIEIAGTNSFLNVPRFFRMLESSVLAFELGKTRPVREPMVKATTGYVWYWGSYIDEEGQPQSYIHWQYESFQNDGTAKLEIDAAKLAFAGGGKDIILMDVSNAAESHLRALATNVEWTSGSGTLTVESYWDDVTNATRWRIVADVDNMAGTILLLR